MSEEKGKVELPECAEWRGVEFQLCWSQNAAASKNSVHFYAESEEGQYLDVSGIYDPDDVVWTWWISGPLGAGGKTFCEAMESWHAGRLEAGDQARLIEDSTCAPTKRTGEE